MRALIGICVVIDALQNRGAFAEAAREISRRSLSGRFTGFVTAKEITDVYYITHRAPHDKNRTLEVVRALLDAYTVLDAAASNVETAVALPMPDYEDAVMCATAVRTGMDCVVTRNIRDHADAPLPVLPPDAFLAKLDEAREAGGAEGGAA